MTMIFQNIVSLFRNRNRKEQGLYHAHTVLQYSKKRAIFSGTIAVYIFACSWISLKNQCIFEKKKFNHYWRPSSIILPMRKCRVGNLKLKYIFSNFPTYWSHLQDDERRGGISKIFFHCNFFLFSANYYYSLQGATASLFTSMWGTGRQRPERRVEEEAPFYYCSTTSIRYTFSVKLQH